MSNPMKNPDRDEDHRRRRQSGGGESDPDGRAVAAALYGGDTEALDKDDCDSPDEPTLFD